MGFLELLQEQTIEAESPRSFFLWSGLAAISAVTKKNTWINKKIYKLYPNIYVMLVARSGLRKGYPVKLAQRLVERLEITKVISGRNSIQSIIRELSKQWTLESGKVLHSANAFLVNDELGTFLIDDPQAQPILTTLYDSFYHNQWTNTLKSEGRETLKDINITMLSATNETHLNAFLDATSVSGGFIGRTLIVRETQKSRLNALVDFEGEELVTYDYKELIQELESISKVTGQAKLSPSGRVLYKEWYEEFNRRLAEAPDNDSTGLSDRLHDHVLKISLLLSLSDKSFPSIQDSHIQRAIDLCSTLIISTKIVTQGKGKSELADKNKLFLDYILSQEDFKALRSKILSAKYGDIDAIDLDRIVDTMKQAGFLVQVDTSKGPQYQIVGELSERFREYQKKKNESLVVTPKERKVIIV